MGMKVVKVMPEEIGINGFDQSAPYCFHFLGISHPHGERKIEFTLFEGEKM